MIIVCSFVNSFTANYRAKFSRDTSDRYQQARSEFNTPRNKGNISGACEVYISFYYLQNLTR